MIKLNIGAGKGHPVVPGWTIVDIGGPNTDVKVNISCTALPFEDDTVSIIFTSHMLEHIYPKDINFVLSEFYRVLKPKGLLRIIVPDIKQASEAYVKNDIEFFHKADMSYRNPKEPIGGLFCNWVYSIKKQPSITNGHVNCFDMEYMSFLLKNVGFKDIVQSGWKNSSLEELRTTAFDRHRIGSLFMEAIK